MNQLTETLDALQSSKASILDLTVSNPTRCGFKYNAEAILDAFQQAHILDYVPQAKGLLSARKVVADYYSRDHRAAIDPESICLTTSTSEAYSFIFRLLCNPHDEVLLPQPSYPLFEFLADLQDVSLIPYTLEYAHGWFIDFQSLQRALTPRTRSVLLVHPNNPTGSYLREEEIRRLNDICRERELALIVDEVFLDYAFSSEPQTTLATNQDCLTFTLSGLSKISALPQMKVAWIATSGPASLTKTALERLDVIADTYLSLNAPAQLALPPLFDERFTLQPQIRNRVLENRAYLQAKLSLQGSCQLLDAQGGWYAVLKMPTSLSDEAVAIRLLQHHHTLVHPGHFYNFSGDNFLVLSLITPTETFHEGVPRLLNCLATR